MHLFSPDVGRNMSPYKRAVMAAQGTLITRLGIIRNRARNPEGAVTVEVGQKPPGKDATKTALIEVRRELETFRQALTADADAHIEDNAVYDLLNVGQTAVGLEVAFLAKCAPATLDGVIAKIDEKIAEIDAMIDALPKD